MNVLPITAEEATATAQKAIALMQCYNAIREAAEDAEMSCTVVVEGITAGNRAHAVLVTKGFKVSGTPHQIVKTSGVYDAQELSILWGTLEFSPVSAATDSIPHSKEP